MDRSEAIRFLENIIAACRADAAIFLFLVAAGLVDSEHDSLAQPAVPNHLLHRGERVPDGGIIRPTPQQ